MVFILTFSLVFSQTAHMCLGSPVECDTKFLKSNFFIFRKYMIMNTMMQRMIKKNPSLVIMMMMIFMVSMLSYGKDLLLSNSMCFDRAFTEFLFQKFWQPYPFVKRTGCTLDFTQYVNQRVHRKRISCLDMGFPSFHIFYLFTFLSFLPTVAPQSKTYLQGAMHSI